MLTKIVLKLFSRAAVYILFICAIPPQISFAKSLSGPEGFNLKENNYDLDHSLKFKSLNKKLSGEDLQKAQERIEGVVKDKSGTPIEGVSVQIVGTRVGVITNSKGEFSLLAEPTDSLEISFVGYRTQVVPVGSQTKFQITLETITSSLNTVVVIGYGTQKKGDLTGSISSIKGSDISAQAIINPVQALTGLASGVQTLQNSGQPGNTLNVIVRGNNSVLGGNNPLYVVDGFPYSGSLNNINPNNIASMEVLKDAAATAIYGSRGSNGVVIVTTKKGLPGKTNVEYDAYYGRQRVTKKLDMLDAKEFATLANVRAANDGITPYFTQNQIDSFGVGTNWQNEIFRIAPIQNHSLNISGGNENSTFFLAGNYINQDGIIINSKYEQGQLKGDFSQRIYKSWKIEFNGIFSRTVNNQLNSDNSERGLGVLSGALVAPPTLPVRDIDGNFTNVRAYPFSPDILENPVAMALETKRTSTNNSFLPNLVLNGNITPALSFHTSIGLQYNVTRNDIYSPTIFQQSASGTASVGYTDQTHLVNENILTYSKDLGINSKLSIMGGLTSEKTITNSVVAGATGFPNDILQNNSLQSGSVPSIPTSDYSKFTLLSWIGRANYSFKNKYLLTATIRADGSSVFGTTNKWGYFPSFSGAWKVSDEDFWAGLKGAVSEFKLRGSWGQTGNTALSPYQSLDILSSSTAVFGDNLYIGFAPGTVKPNPDLKWETTAQTDIGVDLLLINERVSLTFDYYRKITRDLLASIPLPPSSGFSSQPSNIGRVQNHGIEIDLNTHIINRGQIRWDLGGTFSLNRNKVLELAGGADIFGASMGSAVPAMSLVRVGQPIGVFYGYVENGIGADGKIIYEDLHKDGVINSLDRTVIGNPSPKYIFGINSNLTVSNFNLSIIVNSLQGNNVLAYDLSSIANGFYFGENQLKEVLGNYWTQQKPDPNAQYPKVSSATRYLGSNRYIKDGSYIRLQNIQLSYRIQDKELSSAHIQWIQVYVSGQNLFTIDNYPLFAPDNNTFGAGISRGIDMMGYPNAKTIMVGLRVKF